MSRSLTNEPEAIDRVECRLTAATKDAPAFSYVAAGYFDAISEAGAIPVVIPPMAEDDDVSEVLDRVDGVRWWAGPIWIPAATGSCCTPPCGWPIPAAKTSTAASIKMVARRRMPVFGVGSGMQLINVSQGGTCSCTSPKTSQGPAASRPDRQEPSPLAERDAGHRHGACLRRGEIRVNSMHHMAVDEVARGFIVSARCPDGVIEAIRA